LHANLGVVPYSAALSVHDSPQFRIFFLSNAHYCAKYFERCSIKGAVMTAQAPRMANLFSGDAVTLVNGFVRIVSHLVMAPVERVAAACDVAGLVAARRAAWPAGSRLYRAAGRDGHRVRRRGLFGCLHYLSELT
jgi:hypothetical protein